MLLSDIFGRYEDLVVWRILEISCIWNVQVLVKTDVQNPFRSIDHGQVVENSGCERRLTVLFNNFFITPVVELHSQDREYVRALDCGVVPDLTLDHGSVTATAIFVFSDYILGNLSEILSVEFDTSDEAFALLVCPAWRSLFTVQHPQVSFVEI